jgi:hypothetical protein
MNAMNGLCRGANRMVAALAEPGHLALLALEGVAN